MKPPFTSSQEMYNYAANQLVNQDLSPETVKNNLMERGVTDADAETVVQNMLVVIEKNRKADGNKKKVDTKTAEQAFSSSQKQAFHKNNYGQFATTQEMYNYAANQLIVQKLDKQTVKRNLLNKGVSDFQADSVIANMMVEIEKNKPASTGSSTSVRSSVTTSTGSFATSQEMYNYAADLMIVKKLNNQVVKNNLMQHGLSSVDADTVIKNMMAEIEKNKPAQRSERRAEGKRMMLGGLVIFAIGAVLAGTNFNIAGETYVFTYSIMGIGAIVFFKGLFKIF